MNKATVIHWLQNEQVNIYIGAVIVLEGSSAHVEACSGVIDETTVPESLSGRKSNVGGPIIPNTSFEFWSIYQIGHNA